MDLLDRYLGAVGALLPKAQREDIVAELRDVLLNRIEEKEEAKGAPLTDKEREAVLKDFGHPLAVAGRYGPQQSLIGPTLYPFYVFALKLAVALAAIVTVVPAVVVALLGRGEALDVVMDALTHDFPRSALMLAGLVTLVAAGIERGWVPLTGLTDWNVRDLPQLTRKKGMFEARFEALFEVVATALFILWWTGLWRVDLTGAVTLEGAIALAPSPVWASLYWPILVWAVLGLGASLIALVRPGLVRARAVFDLLTAIGGMVLTTLLWKSLPLFTLTPVTATAKDVGQLQHVVDTGFHIGMFVAGLIFACQIGAALWRLYKGAR
ncbi:hypothetical protein DMC25_06635 [Caulobacter sp. D4A]|uniref:hypothetical protein n=1 Tax=unclassified Caulobacter TaxID=2648921 RepID=UPI000D72E20F|nr:MULTISPECIES: hypothetical protein [unclassified Caulobacter]PXA91062.1 hypothetical protein DMC25_06635 [Caulobacter sp. D4A]PXA91067.1 hypothetical protein DMC18_13865 [Caulobacter sp. D5]